MIQNLQYSFCIIRSLQAAVPVYQDTKQLTYTADLYIACVTITAQTQSTKYQLQDSEKYQEDMIPTVSFPFSGMPTIIFWKFLPIPT